MAKAVKVKKVKEVVEEPKVELPIEPIVETPEIGEVPPSVTLEEVKEVEKAEEPIIEEKVEPIVEKVVAPEPIKEVVSEELPIEQKIANYLNDKEGELRINDFLKSLFGIPKFNEPAQWLLQGNSKYLKSVLEGMQANGSISIKDNRHRLLGQFYYPDSTTGKMHHHNLNTVEIIVKK